MALSIHHLLIKIHVFHAYLLVASLPSSAGYAIETSGAYLIELDIYETSTPRKSIHTLVTLCRPQTICARGPCLECLPLNLPITRNGHDVNYLSSH